VSGFRCVTIRMCQHSEVARFGGGTRWYLVPITLSHTLDKDGLMTQSSSGQDSSGPQTDLELLKSIYRDIISRLEDRKRSLDLEIRNYPTPITRCDDQFNYLLQRRTTLSRQLTRMRAPSDEGLALNEYVELIIAFLRELQ
jgi:hypothetical protein